MILAAARQVAICASAAMAMSLAMMTTPVCAQDYAAIVAQPDRTDADRQTDKRRDPVNLLTFTGAKTGWTVLDMGAGAGYSTELMARSVGPTGKVYGQNDADSEKLRARMTTPAHAQCRGTGAPVRRSGARGSARPRPHHLLLRLSRHDLYADRSRQDGQGHVRRAEARGLSWSSRTIQLGRKMAPPSARPIIGLPRQTLRAEIEAAGFKFVADAAFLRHPDDARTAIVFRNPTPVDEFVLKFRKPM